jgi:large subunit ribosomal protein L23
MPTQVLQKPIITEKSLHDTSRSIFTFMVDLSATKPQIAEAVKATYKVDVIKVATRVCKGKSYHSGRRRQAYLKTPTKKAFVQLKSGQTIAVFDIKDSET